MPSAIVLRALVGAGLGLGALDLAWINVALAPRLGAPERPQPALVVETTPPVVEAVVTPQPSVTPIEDEEEPSPPPAPVGTSVYFETGSAELSAASRKSLADLVARAPEGSELVSEGHADRRGPERVNEELSKDRAVAVQEALIQLGVSRARIHVTYAGAASASTDLWRDRRVDIQIVGGTR